VTKVPWIAAGTDELGDEIPPGAKVACGCGGEHQVKWKDGELTDKLLAYYKCGGVTLLAGVNGRLLPGERLVPPR